LLISFLIILFITVKPRKDIAPNYKQSLVFVKQQIQQKASPGMLMLDAKKLLKATALTL